MDKVHPDINWPDSATHFICTSGPTSTSTHHLVSRGFEQRCRYCGRTDKQIRKQNGLSR